jgi:hypothetical protein
MSKPVTPVPPKRLNSQPTITVPTRCRAECRRNLTYAALTGSEPARCTGPDLAQTRAGLHEGAFHSHSSGIPAFEGAGFKLSVYRSRGTDPTAKWAGLPTEGYAMASNARWLPRAPVEFAIDSPLEGAGFEPSVPRQESQPF